MTPSLTRGWVCNLLLLLGLTSAAPLGSESCGTQDHNLLSQFLRLPKHGGPGSPYLILQGHSGSVIPPGTGFPFLAYYDSQGYSGGILSNPKAILRDNMLVMFRQIVIDCVVRPPGIVPGL
jgi:hypothetical protein